MQFNTLKFHTLNILMVYKKGLESAFTGNTKIANQLETSAWTLIPQKERDISRAIGIQLTRFEATRITRNI